MIYVQDVYWEMSAGSLPVEGKKAELGRGRSKAPLPSLTGLCAALKLGWPSAVVQVGEIRAFLTLCSSQRTLDAGCP